MVRTKGDRVPTKAAGGKAPSKVKAVSVAKKSTQKRISHGSGHRAHPRETPKWQKPITLFIDKTSKTTESEVSTSKEKIENQNPNQNTEESTDEEDSD